MIFSSLSEGYFAKTVVQSKCGRGGQCQSIGHGETFCLRFMELRCLLNFKSDIEGQQVKQDNVGVGKFTGGWFASSHASFFSETPLLLTLTCLHLRLGEDQGRREILAPKGWTMVEIVIRVAKKIAPKYDLLM